MIAAHETFDGTWPFAPRFSSAAGFRQHYLDEGPPESEETVLLLHGEPTWGYLFRNVIPALSRSHRVVVPDHMGFGKSETPTGRVHDLGAHIDNLEALVLELDLRNLTLVMHDFGGLAGTGVALRHPDRISRLVVANAPLLLGLPGQDEHVAANLAEAPWFRWIVDAHADGSLRPVLGHLEYNILSTMALNGLHHLERADDTWLRAYAAPFAPRSDTAGALGWALGIAEGTLTFEPTPFDSVEALRSKPALAIWGMRDPTLLSRHFLPIFWAAFPAAPIHQITDASHYVFEDAPATVADLLERFLAPTRVPAR